MGNSEASIPSVSSQSDSCRTEQKYIPMNLGDIIPAELEASTLREAFAFPRSLTRHQRAISELLSLDNESESGIRPDMKMVDRKILDRLLADMATREDLDTLNLWEYWEDSRFYRAMVWWGGVCDAALGELQERGAKSEVDRQLAKVTSLSIQVHAAFPAVQEEYRKDFLSEFTSNAPFTVTFELARRYRLYTQYVESLLMEVWPNLNGKLLQNAFCFACD